MKFNIERGSIYAKILAAENIAVEQDPKASTAYFDVKNRVLVLPMWEGSESLFAFLLVHECSHAIYTPPQEWVDVIKSYPEEEQQAFQSYLNVFEDARIDKLIQDKYRGVKRFYISGTRELAAKDFFKLKDLKTSVDDLPIIDKVNIYFKATKYHNDLKVNYSSEDKKWIDRADNLRTFDDVIKAAKELFEQTKHMLPKTHVSKITIVVDGLGDTGNGSSSTPSSSKPIEVKVGSQTLKALKEALQEQAASKSEQSQIQHDASPSYFYIKDKDATKYIYNPPVKKSGIDNVSTFFSDNRQIVSYMSTVFERKKRAKDYLRIQESKTGVLDTAKLSKYMYSEDLFLTKTIVPECKNHGFIFLLDCSSSMQGVFSTVLQQLSTLIMFCRKIGVPFEVYGFSDHYVKGRGFFNGQIGLVNLASSQMKQSKIIENLTWAHSMNLSSTPLSDALLLSINLIERFKAKHKCDKLNLITLTDGGCTNNPRYSAFTDRKTGVSYKVGKNISNHTDNTNAIYEVIKARTGANIIAYFVTGNFPLPGNTYSEASKDFRKNKFATVNGVGGTDVCYYVAPSLLQVKNIKDTSTESIDKKYSGIVKSRVLTEKFVSSMA